MPTLIDKVALVTGGSRGIGAAIARRLAADGATVALTYRDGKQAATAVASEIEASGGKALAVQADSSKVQEIEAAIAAATNAFGRIDILVNNAGVMIRGPIEQLSLAEFDDTIAVNLRAVFVATKAVLPVMPDGGRIISIGSNLAVRAPGPGLSLYTASKAAVTGLSQALARDLGPRQITVNVVHPGSTDTDMNPADNPASDSQKGRMANPARFADPSEIASVVAYLASPAARSVTGAAWTIDNGANA